MNAIRSIAKILAGTSLVALASCGGGDDKDAGSLTAFNIVPSSMTLTGPNPTTCGAGSAGRVFVYGGTGPYRINNTLPDNVALSKSSLGESGDFFDVTFLGGCMENVSVVVVDDKGRQVLLSLTSVVGE
jgi:hypothetical protein